MAAPGKFLASIGPYKFYKTPTGDIVDEQGRPAPKKIIDSLSAELNEYDVAQETTPAVEQERVKASVNTPKPKGKKREAAKSLGGIIGRNILQSAFPGPYNLYQQYKETQEEKKDQEFSEYKRDAAALRTGVDYTNTLMKDSSSLVRESLSEESRIQTLLSSILSTLEQIRTILLVKSLADKLKGGGGGRGRRGRFITAAKGALTIGSIAAATEMLSNQSPSAESNQDSKRIAGTPVSSVKETQAITEAKEKTLKKDENLVIEAVNLLFKGDKISFETNKLTIDADNLTQANSLSSATKTESSSSNSGTPAAKTENTPGGGAGGSGGSPAAPGGGETPAAPGSPPAPGSPDAKKVGGETPAGEPTTPPEGGKYNESSAYALMKQAGATDEEAKVFAKLAMRESKGDPNAHNDKAPDDSYGLWQINLYGKMGPERLKLLGLSNPEQLKDPAINARAALALYRGQLGGAGGWQHWTTYKKEDGGPTPAGDSPTPQNPIATSADEIMKARSAIASIRDTGYRFAEGTKPWSQLTDAEKVAASQSADTQREEFVKGKLKERTGITKFENKDYLGAGLDVLGTAANFALPFGTGMAASAGLGMIENLRPAPTPKPEPQRRLPQNSSKPAKQQQGPIVIDASRDRLLDSFKTKDPSARHLETIKDSYSVYDTNKGMSREVGL